MPKKIDSRIFSKEDKKQGCLSCLYWLFLIFGLCLLIVYGIKFWDIFSDFSTDHKHWVETATILSSVMSIIGFGALIITFREAQKSTRRSNTLSVCIDIFRELRSEEFLGYEKIIRKKLPKEYTGKTIDGIEDAELRGAVKSYLNIINNISALVIHNIVDDEPIIAYKGMGILYFYELLKPYIDSSRDEASGKISDEKNVSDEVKQIIGAASRFSYAHYELFVKQIKSKSGYLIDEFTSKVNQ